MKFEPAIYCKMCGIIILNSSIKEKRRAYCRYCYKQETKEIWQWKKDIENEKRRPKRRKEQRIGKCICCSATFETARKNQVTCGKKECKDLMKNVKAKLARREKNKNKGLK